MLTSTNITSRKTVICLKTQFCLFEWHLFDFFVLLRKYLKICVRTDSVFMFDSLFMIENQSKIVSSISIKSHICDKFSYGSSDNCAFWPKILLFEKYNTKKLISLIGTTFIRKVFPPKHFLSELLRIYFWHTWLYQKSISYENYFPSFAPSNSLFLNLLI